MLVTFTSSSSGDIIMFADIAHRLLEIIGKRGTARGIFTKEQLPEAVQQLRQAVAVDKENVSQMDHSPSINLSQRAYSIIEMMELTRKAGGFITWQAANDF